MALILGQRLGREQVQGAGVRVFDALLQDRQVVGQRLARGGGRDQHHVAAGTGQLEAALLMGVPRGNAAPLQRAPQAPVDGRRKRHRPGIPGRQHLPMADPVHERRVAAQVSQDLFQQLSPPPLPA